MTGIALTRCHNLVGVLQDLAPTATHIATSLDAKMSPELFERSASKLLDAVSREYRWMYQTKVEDQALDVRYFIWSDIYLCDACGTPIRIWDVEGDESVGGLKKRIPCLNCNAMISKQTMDPLTETIFDHILSRPIERIRSEPVLKVIVRRNRAQKIPVDDLDKEILARIQNQDAPRDAPIAKMLFKDNVWGDQWRSSYHLGVTHLHHFFTYRNFLILCALWHEIGRTSSAGLQRMLRFWFTASISRMTRLNRYMAQHNRHVGPLAGTLLSAQFRLKFLPFTSLETRLVI